MARVQSIDEALKLERELERLNTLMDQYQGQLSRLAHLTDFVTLLVVFHTALKPGPLGLLACGIYQGLRWLFIRS